MSIKHVSGLGLVMGLAVAPNVAHAIWSRQVIPLVAGWNAVYMRVNPYEYGCNKVFGGGGISQVTWWNFDRRDDGTGTVTADSYAWYRDTPEASTFGAVLGDECYLIKAVVATNLTVVGTPALPRGIIRLGKPNLVGVSTPLSNPQVSYHEYYQYLTGLADQPYWGVTTANESVRLGPGTIVSKTGTAIWLETVGEGETKYTGPLEVSVDTSDKILAWQSSTAARTLTVKNVAGAARTVTISLAASDNPPPGQGTKAGLIALKRERIDWSAGYARRIYDPISFPIVTNLAAGATLTLKMRPDLDKMKATSAGDYLGILRITDGSNPAACEFAIGAFAAGNLANAADPSGLWVGSVALTGVNRAKMLSSAEPEWDPEAIQDATQPFEFRLILHRADDGAVKLLKQAFVGANEANTSIAAVMTDKAVAKAYRRKYPNAAIRRVSSANFPFQEPKAFDNPSGFQQEGGKLTVSFTQFYDAKDNPFLHGFHPNHDNLAFNNGKPSKKEDGATGTGDYESWNVTRQVTLTFAGSDPTGAASEDWNKTVCGGTYREEITGLNKTPIIVEGAFRLYRSLETPDITSVP